MKSLYSFNPIMLLLIAGLLFCACQKKSDKQTGGIAVADSVASADGVMIHYQVQGSGVPELVFVHGWLCSQIYWKEQVKQFSTDHRVVTIDLAGHGMSGKNREEYTIPSFGEDVAAVVSKLNLKRTVLVGHSMGGPVIVETAKRLPGRVIGLVGVDTFHSLKKVVTEEEYEGVATALKEDFTGSLKAFVSQALPSDADSALKEWIAADAATVSPKIALKVYKCIVGLDLAAMVQGVNLPIIAINSELWPTDTEGNSEIVPTFETVLLSGLGHFPMLEDPVTFNGHLNAVVQRVAAHADVGRGE